MRRALPLVVCVGILGAAPPATVLFSETFDTAPAGWTLGPEWQIGQAKASKGHAQGNPDPASDHTGRVANGIAGVQIGGNALGASHSEPYWLTSPIISVSGARRVALHFERWLNSDQAPYMTNRVEVYNGKVWVVVWDSTNAGSVADAGWVHQTFDISAHQNAKLQVRFGFARQPGAFAASSWNLDDVRVEAELPEPRTSWGLGVFAALLALVPFLSAR
ncbi:MAG: hypothetical protein HYX27_04160 [Acidobacteria bacterium]|nr:hypothetical protein [Acidobacteriota bacterium]